MYQSFACPIQEGDIKCSLDSRHFVKRAVDHAYRTSDTIGRIHRCQGMFARYPLWVDSAKQRINVALSYPLDMAIWANSTRLLLVWSNLTHMVLSLELSGRPRPAALSPLETGKCRRLWGFGVYKTLVLPSITSCNPGYILWRDVYYI